VYAAYNLFLINICCIVMTNSIKWRLVTIYVLLVVIVMIASGTLIIYLSSMNEYDSLEEELKSAVTLIKNSISEEPTNINDIEIGLKSIIQTYGELFSNKKVYLLDNNGDIIYPVSVGEFENESLYYPQVMSALYNQKIEKLDKVYLQNSDDEYRGYAEPIMFNNKVYYVVYILASTQTIKEEMQGTTLVILLAIILAIIIAAILGILFSTFLTKPIAILTNKAREMAAGNLDKLIEVESDDEIGELTKNFNMMAISLNDTLGQISGEKNKLETVFSHMTDGILVFNKDGNLIHNNPASIRMLNTANKSNFKQVFNGYLEEPFDKIIERVTKETIQHIIQVDNRYYNVCLAKFLNQKDSVMGIICVIQDITKHKKLEEMQKEFVANVSHELRTPLTTIKSYAETLLNGAMEEKEVAQHFLQVINHEGDRMTALVADLLELSKLDNKQTNFKMKEILLNSLVEDSVEKYKIHANKKKQKLAYSECSNNLIVIGDSNRVEQVLKNIISNAVKYSPEEASIDVKLYTKNDYAVIEVKDTGMGIPEEDIARIFERFYRVDKARSRELGGTGLGLAIAKEIMEYHGGKIEVESTLGQGTTFYMYFPKKLLANS